MIEAEEIVKIIRKRIEELEIEQRKYPHDYEHQDETNRIIFELEVLLERIE